MKHRTRIDPYALNPEKLLAADVRKNQKKPASASEVFDETASEAEKAEGVLGHVFGISGKIVWKKKPNQQPPDPIPPSGAGHL